MMNDSSSPQSFAVLVSEGAVTNHTVKRRVTRRILHHAPKVVSFPVKNRDKCRKPSSGTRTSLDYWRAIQYAFIEKYGENFAGI